MVTRAEARLVILCVACAGPLLGCGGSRTSPHTASSPTHAAASARAVWAAETQELCRDKRAAVAKLGYVQITNAGIARVGLPTVKRALDGYLTRLLGVLQDFYLRQQQVSTPPSVAAAMAAATEVDRRSQSATSLLRREVAGAKSAAELSAAFRTWIGTLQRLAARGDSLAQQVTLPSCTAR